LNAAGIDWRGRAAAHPFKLFGKAKHPRINKKLMNSLPYERILRIPISLLNLESTVSRALRAWDETGSPFTVAFANPHSLVVSSRDELFRNALESTSVVAPDGTGIVLASKLSGGKLKTRVTGSDFFEAMSRSLNSQERKRYFFLGSNPETLAKLRIRFEKLYPSIIFAGAYSPPYKDAFSAAENAEMISAVNAARADVLWVSMTAPKQEKWVHQNASSLNVKVIGAVGAVFDYFTGQVRRPGKAWRACGLEWLPRLIQQPRRLWRRNFVSTPQFLYLMAKERLHVAGRRSQERLHVARGTSQEGME
jgi:N-acetylglucosaminyldiphosphoundecaprenol N-acetyl-beta-D-mannosaminyltransferase